MRGFISMISLIFIFINISMIADEEILVKVPVTSTLKIKKNLLLIESRLEEKLTKTIFRVCEIEDSEKKDLMVSVVNDNSQWKKRINFPPINIDLDKINSFISEAKSCVENEKEKQEKLSAYIKKFRLTESHLCENFYYSETRNIDKINSYLYLFYPEENIIISMFTNKIPLPINEMMVPKLCEIKAKKKLLEINSGKDFFGDRAELIFYELDKKATDAFINIIKKEENKFWNFSEVYPGKNLDLHVLKNHLKGFYQYLENDKKKKEVFDALIKGYKLLEEHKLEGGYYYENRHLGGANDIGLYILLPDENILIYLISTT